jgi:MSHA biogenesis protein MshP
MIHTVSIQRRCAGFALVTAIFILVALSVLAAAIIVVVRTQQTQSTLDTAGARAYQAARAGIEAGAYNSLRNNTCAAQRIQFGGTLAAYVVNVACARTTHSELGTTSTGLPATSVNADTITANACTPPNPATDNCPVAGAPAASYVERQITVTVSQALP